MPSPSYWPVVIAFAITMVGGGLIVWQAHAIAGLTIMAAMGLLGMRGIYGWVFEPLEEPPVGAVSKAFIARSGLEGGDLHEGTVVHD